MSLANDMISARIVFDNGMVSNIQYSPFEKEESHRLEIYQTDKKICVDFIKRRISITPSGQYSDESIIAVSPVNGIHNPVKSEIEVFLHKIMHRHQGLQDIEENYASFYLASEIQDKLQYTVFSFRES